MAEPYHYQLVEDSAMQSQRVACGPNALYMFLAAHGMALPYEEIRARLAMKPEGCTMLALRDAATQCGIRARVVKCSAADLKHVALPAILHFNGRVNFGDNVKHYVLLTSVSDEGIEYLDGTTAWHEVITLKKFATISDGYVLERCGTSDLGSISLLVSIIVLMGAVASLRRHSLATRVRAGLTTMALFLAALDFGARAADAGTPNTRDSPALSADVVWRAPAADAINALDLYCKVIKHAACRETIAQSLPHTQRVTIAQLAEAARARGVSLQAVRPPIASLETAAFPVIVHLLDDKEQNGGFYLLLSYNANQVEVVNAALATIEIIGADEFRRRWSGYALVRDETELSSVGTAGVVLVTLAGYLLFRCRRARSNFGCLNDSGAVAVTLDGDRL